MSLSFSLSIYKERENGKILKNQQVELIFENYALSVCLAFGVRGHMARRQDMKWSEQAVKESDYFTNICPQNKEMNNGVWHHFKAFLIKHQDAYHTIAFICPNSPDSVTIAGTARSVNTVESFTGYDFFGFLDDGVEETIENEVEVGRWVR